MKAKKARRGKNRGHGRNKTIKKQGEVEKLMKIEGRTNKIDRRGGGGDKDKERRKDKDRWKR